MIKNFLKKIYISKTISSLVNLIGLGQQENNSDLSDVNIRITKKIIALSKRSKIKKFV